LNLIFAGTPEFARIALAQLHAAGHRIALVLTQPDRPAGRGMKMQASPVKQFALENAMALAQPHSLRLECCRAGAVLRQSTGPLKRATATAASPSCKWMQG